MRITILGAGAWGTALAIAASRQGPGQYPHQNECLLWARSAQQVQALQTARCNQRYLPDLLLPAALQLTADLPQALAHGRGGLTIVATTMAGLREQLLTLAALPSPPPVLWLCKGFEAGSAALGHEIARDLNFSGPMGALSGPSFALEVARGQPTALVAASVDEDLSQLAVQAFHSEVLRIYTSTDLVGVEVAGAVKNVLAIATGINDGLPDTALNARAALITRGLAEMTRLGLALGAQAQTFMGLAGLGDLVLTCTGDLSRNRRVGLMLAAGQPLPAVLAQLGHVAEGVLTAPMVLQRARGLGVRMPICEAVVDVLQGRLQPSQALTRLMARQPRTESIED